MVPSDSTLVKINVISLELGHDFIIHINLTNGTTLRVIRPNKSQRLIIRSLIFVVALIAAIASAAASHAQSAGVVTLRQILSDRPGMRSYIDSKGFVHQIVETDEIFIAAAELLTSDGAAGQVDWNKIVPDKQCETADHQLAIGQQRAAIHIGEVEKCNDRAGQPLGFERLWHELFYELFNIQNDASFLQLFQDGTRGKYSECEYTVENTKLEYNAEVKLSNFYKNEFAPWAAAHGLPTDERYWVTSIKPTYEQWIAQYKDPKSYPWDYWSAYFNQYLVPYMQQTNTPVPTRSCNELPSAESIQAPPNVTLSASAALDHGNDYWKRSDYTHAFVEFQQACNGGNLSGCQDLGVLYAQGQGVARDYVKAGKLFKQACDGGEMNGCENLGDLYKFNLGDLNRARELYNQACKGGLKQGCADRDALSNH